MILGVIGYGLWRLVRPKTFREVAGGKATFLERLGPKLGFYGKVTGSELRDEVAGELKEMFQESMDEHQLAAQDYELVFVRDDFEGETAVVRRTADGRTWSLAEFDDHLLISSGDTPRGLTAHCSTSSASCPDGG